MNNSAYIFDVTEENFTQIVIKNSESVPVMVDFWASWCGPCKTLMPILSKLAVEFNGKFILAKVNSDEQQQLAGTWGVRSLPTVKLFRDGTVKGEFVGAQSESNIRLFLDQYVERDSDKYVNQALEILHKGDQTTAINLLQDTVVKDPQNKRAFIELLRIHIDTKDYTRAHEFAKSMPANVQTESEVVSMLSSIDFALDTHNNDDLEETIKKLKNDPSNSALRLIAASHCVLKKDYAAALEYLFEILKQDKNFQDGIAKQRMVKIFDILGGKGQIVSQYRSKMFNLLH